jgi:hypothetical protein
VTNHVFVDENRNVLPTIVNGNCQSDHLRRDHGTTRPGLDGSFVVFLNGDLHFLHQVKIDERAFF